MAHKDVGRLATSRPHEFQVDFMNSGVEYVRGRGRICLAAKRPVFRSRSGRASDEVARGRLVSLEGFSFTFPAKK